MKEASLVRRRSGLICDKILRRHQDRLAIVYVRQSTVQQVERHQELTRLQYALADRAAQSGLFSSLIFEGRFGIPGSGNV